MKNKRIASSYFFNNVLVVAFITFCSCISIAQSYYIDIEWGKSLDYQDGNTLIKIPAIVNGNYEKGLPHFSWQQKVKPATYQLTANQFQLSPVASEDEYIIQKYGGEIGFDPTYQLSVSEDPSGAYIRLGLIPYVFRNNTHYRVTSLNVTATLKQTTVASIQKDYVANSVLSSGTWYKVAVAQDGVFVLNKSFFESLGLNIATLNPQQINVYGNATGRLTESNAAPYFDDLTKNAIVAVGESDGVFNDGDYFLFYGVSPHRLDYNSSTGFEQNRHIYADASYYFIRIDDPSGAERISTLTDNTNPVTNTVGSYDFFAIHEDENINLVGGGQRWYGELFDGVLSQNFSFSIPNLVLTDPVTVQYACATNATSSGNNFKFYLNGSLLQSQSMSTASVDYARNSGTFTFNPTSNDFILNLQFNRVNPSVKGYLDFIEVTARRSLSYSGGFRFRDTRSVGIGNVSRFQLASSNANVNVWDVTNPRSPKSVQLTLNGFNYEFIQATDTLRDFFAFSSADYKSPSVIGRVTNQNLHGLAQADYVIV
ncbi:MAG: hypothetical protein IT221_13570, partial [Fluviicola sp.]|nr:hypothetical protein [Fluviicola sp.]